MDSGNNFLELFTNSNPNTSSSKTSEHCEAEASMSSSKILPKHGMMRNGQVSARHPLVPFINVKGCSLLPTPNATDWKGGSHQRKNIKSQLRHLITCLTGLPYPNPSAYEPLMGFPTGWTELEDSETP